MTQRDCDPRAKSCRGLCAPVNGSPPAPLPSFQLRGGAWSILEYWLAYPRPICLAGYCLERRWPELRRNVSTTSRLHGTHDQAQRASATANEYDVVAN